MTKELELWQFVSSRLATSESIMLLVVAESTGSSPGRARYKMAVAENGELCGSIGGGVMEVALAEKAKLRIENPEFGSGSEIVEQVHRKDVPNSSGMICSGRQTVIIKKLTGRNFLVVEKVVDSLQCGATDMLEITDSSFQVVENTLGDKPLFFVKRSESQFVYREKLGASNRLYIIGGGHCALALSELMSKMDFRISILDDRPELNTIDKNEFADEITIIDGYDHISGHIPSGDNIYVVVMTLGYVSDAVVIRQFANREFKYFGVLGSKAKMATMMKELRAEGVDPIRLASIRTPIGLPINSSTPEEIAVSIAAEIIGVKNA